MDRDGNQYPVIRLVGKQWLGKNLNLNIPDSWCYGNLPANCDQYGRLYTWEAAKTGCAAFGAGWRLPTDEDWQALADAFGGIWKLGERESGESAYKALLKDGSSGFAALLAGVRFSDGEFFDLGRDGYYWSSTENDAADAWLYWFYSDFQSLLRNYYDKGRGFSVRCLKDD